MGLEVSSIEDLDRRLACAVRRGRSDNEMALGDSGVERTTVLACKWFELCL